LYKLRSFRLQALSCACRHSFQSGEFAHTGRHRPNSSKPTLSVFFIGENLSYKLNIRLPGLQRFNALPPPGSVGKTRVFATCRNLLQPLCKSLSGLIREAIRRKPAFNAPGYILDHGRRTDLKCAVCNSIACPITGIWLV